MRALDRLRQGVRDRSPIMLPCGLNSASSNCRLRILRCREGSKVTGLPHVLHVGIPTLVTRLQCSFLSAALAFKGQARDRHTGSVAGGDGSRLVRNPANAVRRPKIPSASSTVMASDAATLADLFTRSRQ